MLVLRISIEWRASARHSSGSAQFRAQPFDYSLWPLISDAESQKIG